MNRLSVKFKREDESSTFIFQIIKVQSQTNKKHVIPHVKIELEISLYTPNKSYQICVLDQFCDRKFISTFELKLFMTLQFHLK
jgi:hypothetical protein